MNQLNGSNNSIELLEFLKNSKFLQKSDWMFSFFETLPETEINSEILKEFLFFLDNDCDKEIKNTDFRNLRILDKFIKIEPNIYPIASSIIYKKRYNNSHIVNIYFKCFFQHDIYSPKELLILYKKNIEILQNIYFYMIKKDKTTDLDGTFLSEFLKINDTWLYKCSQLFWENSKNNIDFNYNINNTLWKSDYYIEYFDYILYNIPELGFYKSRIGSLFKYILSHMENDEIVIQHQQKWINHIIIENAKKEFIYLIFEFVSELNNDIKKEAIKSFLENNYEFEVFDKLDLLPREWDGDESFIPSYKKQIDFLESLYPLVSKIELLNHKAMIKSKVELLEKEIKKEEKELSFRKNLYKY